jgi:hypothetical protein
MEKKHLFAPGGEMLFLWVRKKFFGILKPIGGSLVLHSITKMKLKL